MYKNVPSHQSVFRTMNLPQSTAPKKPPPQFSRSKPRDPRWPSPAWGPWPPVVPPIWRASRFWSSPSGIADKKGRFFTRKKTGCHEEFGDFCFAGFGFFFWLSFPVPFALYLQQFGARTWHFAWYLLHFGMVTLHFACFFLHLATFAFHFAWYLSYFGISTSHLHGIWYILVLQTFMWVSWGFFRLSFKVSFNVSLTVSFRVLFKASFGVSFRVSFQVSLGFHLGFFYGFILGFL